jgi:hypothetical protein
MKMLLCVFYASKLDIIDITGPARCYCVGPLHIKALTQ